MSKIEIKFLSKVSSDREVTKNIFMFNKHAKNNKDVARYLCANAIRWVYDVRTDLFAPELFVAYKDMTFKLYKNLVI